MKPLIYRAGAFAVGIVTALVATNWLRSTRRELPPATAPIVPVHPTTEWDSSRIHEAVAAVGSADGSGGKFEAISRLQQIPLGNVEEALALASSPDDRDLSLAAKVLLIRWAGEDGKAAVLWAWEHLRMRSAWNQAYAQIGPAWAWHDARHYGRWLLEDVSREESLNNESKESLGAAPVLSFEQFANSSRWLVVDEPKLAFQLMIKRGGWSDDDYRLAEGIRTAGKTREAMQGFPALDLSTGAPVGLRETLAMTILERWQDLDPENYRQSGYHFPGDESRFPAETPVLSESSSAPSEGRPADDLDGVLAGNADLSPAKREAAFVDAFDIWGRAHPGAHPDVSAWTPSEISAWQDLEILNAMCDQR